MINSGSSNSYHTNSSRLSFGSKENEDENRKMIASAIAMAGLGELERKSQLMEVFRQLGGEDGIRNLVKRVYQYNVTDLRIAHFFDIAMVERFERMFVSFLVGLLGGKPYNREQMITSHKRFGGLKDKHFDAFIHNFTIAMMHEQVNHSAINIMVGLMETTREDVTGRTKLEELPSPHVVIQGGDATKCPFCCTKLDKSSKWKKSRSFSKKASGECSLM